MMGKLFISKEMEGPGSIPNSKKTPLKCGHCDHLCCILSDRFCGVCGYQHCLNEVPKPCLNCSSSCEFSNCQSTNKYCRECGKLLSGGIDKPKSVSDRAQDLLTEIISLEEVEVGGGSIIEYDFSDTEKK